MFAIEGININKSYGENNALCDFSLSIKEGSIFGLLGPNGAGKTTFLKGLLDLVTIDSGEYFIQGVTSKNKISRKNIGYLQEKFSFYPFYTVYNTLKFYGAIRDIKNLESTILQALKKLDIFDIRNQKIKTLSKGQLQRVGIASLLIGNHNIFIIDEPFSGLDPIGIKEIKDLFKELKTNGKTIFINSHILSEMEIICDEVGIINKGKLLTNKSIKEINSSDSLENYFYQLIQNEKES